MDDWGITAVGYLVSLLGAAPGGPACLELATLDLHRSVAWGSAAPERVADLHVDPAAAAPEIEVMATWTERGLVLESAMLMIGSCEVRSEAPDVVHLGVVDRLVPTRVLDHRGTVRTLPRDDWSAREVVLREVDGHWRYASVAVLDSSGPGASGPAVSP